MGEDAEPQGPELLLGAARGERGAECALDAAEDTLHVGALPIAAARKALRGTPALRGAGELVRVAATIERDDRARQAARAHADAIGLGVVRRIGEHGAERVARGQGGERRIEEREQRGRILRRAPRGTEPEHEVRGDIGDGARLDPAAALGTLGPAAIEPGGRRAARAVRVVGARVRGRESRGVDRHEVGAGGQEPQLGREGEAGAQDAVGAPFLRSRSWARQSVE